MLQPELLLLQDIEDQADVSQHNPRVTAGSATEPHRFHRAQEVENNEPNAKGISSNSECSLLLFNTGQLNQQEVR